MSGFCICKRCTRLRIFLNKPEYALIISQYEWICLNPLSANPTKLSKKLKQFVTKLPTNCLSMFDHFVGLALKGLITLNMIEYGGIYLKKQHVEYARILLNVSDTVHSIRSLYSLLSSYRDRRIQNTVKHLRSSVLQKE